MHLRKKIHKRWVYVGTVTFVLFMLFVVISDRYQKVDFPSVSPKHSDDGMVIYTMVDRSYPYVIHKYKKHYDLHNLRLSDLVWTIRLPETFKVTVPKEKILEEREIEGKTTLLIESNTFLDLFIDHTVVMAMNNKVSEKIVGDKIRILGERANVFAGLNAVKQSCTLGDEVTSGVFLRKNKALGSEETSSKVMTDCQRHHNFFYESFDRDVVGYGDCDKSVRGLCSFILKNENLNIRYNIRISKNNINSIQYYSNIVEYVMENSNI